MHKSDLHISEHRHSVFTPKGKALTVNNLKGAGNYRLVRTHLKGYTNKSECYLDNIVCQINLSVCLISNHVTFGKIKQGNQGTFPTVGA